MSSFSVSAVARSDDANEHAKEDLGFEWEEVGELFQEEEDDAG